MAEELTFLLDLFGTMFAKNIVTLHTNSNKVIGKKTDEQPVHPHCDTDTRLFT